MSQGRSFRDSLLLLLHWFSDPESDSTVNRSPDEFPER